MPHCTNDQALVELLTKDEAADRLRVSIHTLNYWLKVGAAPPSARIGRRRYFKAADLDAWIDSKFSDQHPA